MLNGVKLGRELSYGPLRIPWERGCYEAVLRKSANESLAHVGRARGRDCVSGRSNGRPGGSSRRGTRSRARGAQRDLSFHRKFGRYACMCTDRGVDSCICVSNPLECGAERYPSAPAENRN